MERLLEKRGQKGFTLIELLVVIAILAVLGAVAIPAYSRFFSSGEAEANAAELSLLQDAMDAMLADNRINTVVPQPDPTSDFSVFPAGDGTEFLFPAFLRSNTVVVAKASTRRPLISLSVRAHLRLNAEIIRFASPRGLCNHSLRLNGPIVRLHRTREIVDSAAVSS